MNKIGLVAIVSLSPLTAHGSPSETLARPADRVEAEIEAVFSEDLERASIESTLVFTPAAALDEVPIVLAADRYDDPGAALSPSQVREIFPSGFSSGALRDPKIWIDGVPCTPRSTPLEDGGRILWCPRAAAAGVPLRVDVTAELEVPRRYGPFGRAGREVTLGAGWYPYVARPGFAPPRGPHRVRVTAPAELTVVIRSHHFPAKNAGAARTVEAREEDAAQVPLLLRPATHRAISIAGGRARYLSGPASLLQRDPSDSLHHREMTTAIEDALSFWQEEGFTLPEPSQPLIVVRGALRHDLAQAADGLVLVSDRAFRMLDVDRFLRFHRFPILREIFGELVSRRLAASPDRSLASDAIAAWLLDRYVVSRFGRAEDAFDVLGIVSFIPSIDSMLYAPDLPYVSAYFRVIREDDPLRPDLLAYPRGFPRGKLLYEKLTDRAGPARAGALMARLVHGGSIPQIVRDALGDPAEARRFLDTWLGPHPDLQYRLASWSSRPAPERCAGCVLATVELERRGDVASEPIEVRLVDEEGGERIVTAGATTAARRVLTATLAAPLELAELDPRHRLAETPDRTQPSPRYDNRSSPAWKVLLNNFNILFSATEGAIDTALDVGFGRRYDVHWSYAARFDYAQDAISLSSRATYAFGPPVTAARLSNFVTLGVAGELLRAGFAGTESGGTALGASLSYGYDDRQSLWAPESGNAVRLSASVQQVLGTELPDTTPLSVGLSARAVKQWRIGARHQLSTRLSISGYAAGKPRKQLLYALGGRTGLRGYALDAELGRVRAIASAEWLHPLLPELDVNGFFMAWVTGLDGAIYGDIGLIGDDLEQATEGPLFGDVGYGLRLYIDYLGVRPGIMSVDIAFPLVRARDALQLGPPGIYISFSQSFLVF